MATLTTKPSNTLSIVYQKVKKAYLAEKEIVGSEESGEFYPYTFKGNNNTTGSTRKERIAKIIYDNIKPTLDKQNQTTTKEKVKKALEKNSYKKGDCIEIPLIKPVVKFNKLTKVNFGKEVYIVIQTEHMPEREIKMNLKQGKEKVFANVGDPIYVTQNEQAIFKFTAIVGEFSKQKIVANAADFKDYAITKIKLESTDSDKNKEYKDALKKVEGEKTYLYIAMDAEPEDQNWFEVKYEEVVDNRPNLWYYGEGNWLEIGDNSTLEYIIYSNGEIKKNKVKNPRKVIYYYFDKNNNEYNLGELKAHKTKRHTKKDKLSLKEEYVVLVYVKDIKGYNSGNVKFNFATWNSDSQRWYINPDCLAGLLGAMIEESIEDLGFNGFSIRNGNTAGGSSSHINGEKGDLRYLNTNKDGNATHLQYSNFDYDRQVKFNNALYKFGWGRTGKMYSENFNREVEQFVFDEKSNKKIKTKVTISTLLPHTKHMKKTTGKVKYRHHHHLHLTGFDFSKVKEI